MEGSSVIKGGWMGVEECCFGIKLWGEYWKDVPGLPESVGCYDLNYFKMKFVIIALP